MRIALVLTATLLLPPASAVRAQRPIWQLQATAAVVAELRDGGSAKFLPFEQFGSVVCGSVNAKNAYGAYLGFLSFAVILDPDPPALSPLNDVRSMQVIFGTDKRRLAALAHLCSKD